MNKPSNTAFAAEAAKLPNCGHSIPYVPNGSTLSGMDCQGLVEYCLRQVGISKNWSGSNAMLRDTASFLDMGTPEECVRKLGCVPVGACVGIWSDTGEPTKYASDGIGNLGHIGVRVASGKGAVHASSSRGCVAESTFADKTVRGGGWNRVLLCILLDYGPTISALIGQQTEGVTITMSTATVKTSGGTLNLRETSSPGSNVLTTIPNGASVSVLGKTTSTMWNVSYGGITGYAACKYLAEGEAVAVTVDRSVAQALYSAIGSALGV